jgi:hypothetical protein
LALSIVCGAILWAWIIRTPGTGWDAHVYWSTLLANPYASSAAGAPGAYLYAPAFRQLIEPLTLLSWPAFHALWVALLIGLVVVLAGPFAIFVLANPILIFELQAGNIGVLLAAAVVFGFRYPATWAFVLLTKVTPGVGILWFLVRREWRNLVAVAVGTGVVVGVSLVLAPDLWAQWVHSLAQNAAIPDSHYSGGLGGPLWLRGLVAVALVAWGALTDRRWTVPVAATLAIPLLAYINLSLLVAVVPLVLPDAGRLIARWLPRPSGEAAASALGSPRRRGSAAA